MEPLDKHRSSSSIDASTDSKPASSSSLFLDGCQLPYHSSAQQLPLYHLQNFDIDKRNGEDRALKSCLGKHQGKDLDQDALDPFVALFGRQLEHSFVPSPPHLWMSPNKWAMASRQESSPKCNSPSECQTLSISNVFFGVDELCQRSTRPLSLFEGQRNGAQRCTLLLGKVQTLLQLACCLLLRLHPGKSKLHQ